MQMKKWCVSVGITYPNYSNLRESFCGGVFVLTGDLRAEEESLFFLVYAHQFLGLHLSGGGGGQLAPAGNAGAGVGLGTLRERGRGKIGNEPRKIHIVLKAC